MVHIQRGKFELVMRSDVPVRTPPRDAGGETEWIGCRLTAHANSELTQLAHFAVLLPLRHPAGRKAAPHSTLYLQRRWPKNDAERDHDSILPGSSRSQTLSLQRAGFPRFAELIDSKPTFAISPWKHGPLRNSGTNPFSDAVILLLLLAVTRSLRVTIYQCSSSVGFHHLIGKRIIFSFMT